MNEGSVHHPSPPAAKIALFRDLFRGRDDVYPRRFESRKTGRSGYQSACANEWVKGLCDKRSVRCGKSPNRRFLPVSNEAIRWHLWGQDDTGRAFVIGVCPMLQHETCFFVAADFDKKTWPADTEAFLYRRLETLPLTAGRFQLNAELAISFDGRGKTEVDLLDGDARVAVELDGAQHLADSQAYRRNRRKDLQLQQHHYIVLRFLAEDVGTHLDDVLDVIV